MKEKTRPGDFRLRPVQYMNHGAIVELKDVTPIVEFLEQFRTIVETGYRHDLNDTKDISKPPFKLIKNKKT